MIYSAWQSEDNGWITIVPGVDPPTFADSRLHDLDLHAFKIDEFEADDLKDAGRLWAERYGWKVSQ